MKLESQVCSLELAKKLKALNVKQESVFYWKYFTSPKKQWELVGALIGVKDYPGISESVSAFTVAELGEMLPKWIPANGNSHYCNFVTRNYQWEVEYHSNGIWIETADTEADARAKMLCYLLENQLLDCHN